MDRVDLLKQHASIGIITALPEEFAAVEVMLENAIAYTVEGTGAGRRYLLGEVPAKEGGSHVVALGMLADVGNNNASIRATQLLFHFSNVKHLIMCGIAGGIPNFDKPEEHIRLGDIVVSDRDGVVQYDFIKDTPSGRKRIKHKHPPRPPGAELLEAVKILKAESIKGVRPWEQYLPRGAQLEDASRPPDDSDAQGNPIKHPADPKRLSGLPRVFMGPVASANRLVKDKNCRDAIRARFGVKAYEMEASGIADAAWISDRANYLVVRGICDYCDPAKGDLWHGYAAIAAAAYVRALLESMPVKESWAGEKASGQDLDASSKISNYQSSTSWLQQYLDRFKVPIVIFVILAPAISITINYYYQKQTSQLVFLVANFDGQEPQKYRVTEFILRNLKTSTKGKKGVRIQSLGRTITEQEGSEVARAEGRKRKASIVIWGWYGVTNQGAVICMQYENLNPAVKEIETNLEEKGRIRKITVTELENFTIQEKLSEEASCMGNIFVGMIDFKLGDWNRAIEEFNNALAKEKMPVIFLYRGLAYNIKGDYKQAIIDSTEAIRLKPDFAAAYCNRGDAYTVIGDYDRAISDLDRAIELKPDYAEAYHSRGFVYIGMDANGRAINDFNKAISLKSDYAEAYCNKGVAYSRIRRYSDAIASYNEAINLRPRFAEAYCNRASVNSEMGNYDKAIEDCNTAIGINSKLAEAYSNRGVAYYKKGNNTAALADFNEAIKLKPDYFIAYCNRGDMYSGGKDYDKSIMDYDTAIKLNPMYAEAYCKRGIVYDLKGDCDKALKDYDYAIQLNPKYPEAYSNRGVVYCKKGDYEKAIKDFDKAIALNPNIAEAYCNKGDALSKKGNYDEAIACLDRAIELNSTLAEAYRIRGYTLSRKGNNNEAIKDFSKAIELKPEFAEAYCNRAVDLTEIGDYGRAIEDCDAAIRIDPRMAEAFVNRGAAFFKKGDYDKAITDFTNAIGINSKLAEAYANRGSAFCAKGKYDAAIEDCNRAIELKPDHAPAFCYRGMAYRRKGDCDRAISDYSRAIKLKPDYAIAYCNRGVAYFEKRDYDKALGDVDKAIKLRPDLPGMYELQDQIYHSKVR